MARAYSAAAPSTSPTTLLPSFHALNNDRRLQILEWLKDPARHFRRQIEGDPETDGVCAVLLAEKLGISQPTLSEHMRVLVDSGLVDATRVKQWTFYRRNERAIATFKRAVRETL